MLILLSLLSISTALADPNCSNVPDRTSYYDFSRACFKHDTCYSEGPLTGVTKAICDQRFYSHMKASCHGGVSCELAAYTYFLGVQQFDVSVFNAAAKKGEKSLAEMKAANDQNALNLMAKRAAAQKAWTQKSNQCASLSGAAYSTCLSDLDQIAVPAVPDQYNLGKCNLFGVRWKVGDRTSNAESIAKRLGLPLSVVQSQAAGDPCDGYYPYQR